MYNAMGTTLRSFQVLNQFYAVVVLMDFEFGNQDHRLERELKLDDRNRRKRIIHNANFISELPDQSNPFFPLLVFGNENNYCMG
jgi:hypothetical protein